MATPKATPNPYGKDIEEMELRWTAPKLLVLGILTLGAAFTFLYLVSP
jgi:hypothetical protein